MKPQIIKSINKKSEINDLTEIFVNRLTFGEIQSLLLQIFELKTKKKSCSEIFKEFQSNRFVKPSDIDPILKRKLELKVFSLLPDDFQVIDLSPLTPLGTSSVLTTVHQNNVISTIRNTELAADTTNILALECAKRRKIILNRDKKSVQTVKLCASQCLTRGQPFEDQSFSSHFNVIALCTAGRDEGNSKFESFNLLEHIGFYIRVLKEIIYPEEIQRIKIKFYEYAGYDNSPVLENIYYKFAGQDLVQIDTEKNSSFGSGYYSGLRFMIHVINPNDKEFVYVDGGFTKWTSDLLGNKKERLLTSGIGTDFLVRTSKIRIT